MEENISNKAIELSSEQKKSELPSLPPSPVPIVLRFSKWKCIGCGVPSFFLLKSLNYNLSFLYI